MRKMLALSSVCVVLAWSQVSIDQSKIAAEKASVVATGITAALAGQMSSVTGAPYSAQAVTQRIQTLADGNRITQTTTNNVARDSKGRVRRDESIPGAANNGSEAPRLVLIEDPVAGEHITLDMNKKTATRLQWPAAKRSSEMKAIELGSAAPPPMMLSIPVADRGTLQLATAQDAKPDAGNTSVVDLGMQMVEGVSAKGKKITHTIPAGEMGNDYPIVITTETWYSPDLKLTVMSKSSDPRLGETTYRLTNISRAEPDSSLFQIPSDYTVKEQTQNVFYLRTDVEK